MGTKIWKEVEIEVKYLKTADLDGYCINSFDPRDKTEAFGDGYSLCILVSG